MAGNVTTHVGLCVTDVGRSQRFYVEALGFTFASDLVPPDDLTAKLLAVEPPAGLRAVYLTMGTFTLELLHFDREGNPPAATRVMNEPGLTHLSITTPDLPGTVAKVREHGGTVVESTDIGLAVMVRDPDGQLIELLPAKSS